MIRAGRFELRRELGRGGMGVVWEAYDRTLRASVAVKQLQHVSGDSLARFKAEFRGLADLVHPNLVRLRELFCEDSEWFFSMELVDGVDVMRWVRDERGLREIRLRDCLSQIAHGLNAIHSAGKVHRDIKPGNILVRPDGTTLILDFGLVADFQCSGARQEIAGTLAYMAPELADPVAANPAADWYALGVILYEALTGQLPYRETGLAVLFEKQRCDPPPPSQLDFRVPPDLEALCLDLMRRDPAARPGGPEVLMRLDARASTTTAKVPQPAVFVGRVEERRWLERAYADARRGGPTVAVVEGESGVGKTLLVRRFLDELGHGLAEGEEAPLVFSGRCYERESVPFKALDGVVDDLTRYLVRLDATEQARLLPPRIGLVARLFPVLNRSRAVAEAAVPPEVVAPHEQRAAAFDGLRDLMCRIAERRPLVLVVDDLQWADADSASLLEELLRPPGAPRLLVLGTYRTDRNEGDSAPLTRLFGGGLPGVRRLEVGPLSMDDSRQLVEELLDPEAPCLAELAAELAREGGGHPMFLHELVHHVALEAPTGSSRATLDEALWQRISRLHGPARRVMELLAVAGLPTLLGTLAAAAEQSLAACDQVLSELRAAHLVRVVGSGDDVRFATYHDRIREGIVGQLQDGARLRLHGAMATAMEAEPHHDPVLLVQYLVAAGREARGAELAVLAAEEASAKLAFEQAGELYRLALELGHEPWVPVMIRRAEALANAGRGLASAEAFLAAADRSASVAEQLDCRQKGALQLLMSGHVERGVRHLREVLTHVGIALPASSGRAIAPLLWRRFRLGVRGLAFRETDPEQLGERDRFRLHVSRMTAPALSMLNPIIGAEFLAGGLLFALGRGARDAVGHLLALDSVLSSTQGKGARAGDALERSRAIAEQTGDPYLWSWVHFAEGFVHYFNGPFDAAVNAFTLSEARMCELVGTSFERTTIRLWLLASLRLAGEFPRLADHYHAFLRDAILRGDIYARTTLERALNVVWLVKDDPVSAREALAATPWVSAEQGFQLQHWYELRASSEIELYEGPGPGAAERFWTRFEAARSSHFHRVQAIRAEAMWLGARLALADNSRAGRRRRLAHAASVIRAMNREGVAHCEVSAALLAAGLCWRRGAPDEAVSALRRAIPLAGMHGMYMHLAAARRRLGAIVGGNEGRKLVAKAHRWMARQGIGNAARMTALFAPGFD